MTVAAALRRTCAGAIVAALLAPAPLHALVLPDGRLTPGAVGAEQEPAPEAVHVCERGYARNVRHRYDAAWRHYRSAMFREYAIPHDRWSAYTVDHLVPIELGGRPFGVVRGAYDLRNVWPEPKSEAPQKDEVENALHRAVCYRRGYRGLHLSLAAAQRAIARDWTHTPVGLPP